MTPRGSIKKTARAARIRSDVAANGRRVFSGVRRVKLAVGRSCRLDVLEQCSAAHFGGTLVYFDARKVAHRDSPAALRRRPASHACQRAEDSYRDVFRRSACQQSRELIFVSWSE